MVSVTKILPPTDSSREHDLLSKLQILDLGGVRGAGLVVIQGGRRKSKPLNGC